MFAHHCLLAEKRVTTPSHLSRKNFYISSILWHAFISYMLVCYCTAKPLNPGWTYETRCITKKFVGVDFYTTYIKHREIRSLELEVMWRTTKVTYSVMYCVKVCSKVRTFRVIRPFAIILDSELQRKIQVTCERSSETNERADRLSRFDR
jgi:hypothetical protein